MTASRASRAARALESGCLLISAAISPVTIGAANEVPLHLANSLVNLRSSPMLGRSWPMYRPRGKAFTTFRPSAKMST